MAAKKKSSASMTQAKAIQAINRHGMLLTFPMDNREEPSSIWSVSYPGEEMRWEWDDNGDDRVAKLWHLRTLLSTTREVVYAKWFRGRATFFSKETFTHLLAFYQTATQSTAVLNQDAQNIHEILEMDSPQSTKQIKLATDLRGKSFEKNYDRAMKQLWAHGWIVGFGEVDDGAFPSLAVGASQSLFEDLWENSKTITRETALEFLREKLGEESLFFKQVLKNQA
jgi:hypothetical protein